MEDDREDPGLTELISDAAWRTPSFPGGLMLDAKQGYAVYGLECCDGVSIALGVVGCSVSRSSSDGFRSSGVGSTGCAGRGICVAAAVTTVIGAVLVAATLRPRWA